MVKNYDKLTAAQRRRTVLICAALALALLVPVGILVGVSLQGGTAGSDGSSGSELYEEYEWEEEIVSDAVLRETEDAGEEYLEETLFLGDSNTVRLEGFGEIEMNSMAAVVGMGVQSVPTSSCIWFAEYAQPVTMARAAALLQPRRMIMTFGTNNTDMTTEEFIAAYEDAIDALQEGYPYADLIIAAGPPVGSSHSSAKSTQQTIDDFNEALLALAEERELPFLNTAQALKGSDGYLRSAYAEADGIHLTAAGAKAVVRYVRTHSYFTEDRRPALSAQPTRIDPPYVPEETPQPSASASPTPTPTPTPTPSATPAPSATPTPSESAAPEDSSAAQEEGNLQLPAGEAAAESAGSSSSAQQ